MLKIFNFSLNIPNAPLTIENFDFEKLRARTPETKKSGIFTYFAIPFAYDGGEPLMKVEGNFRVFKHVNAGRVNYSLAITVNDENEEFFSELGCKLATLSSNWDANSGLEPLKRRKVESLLTLRFPLTMMEGNLS